MAKNFLTAERRETPVLCQAKPGVLDSLSGSPAGEPLSILQEGGSLFLSIAATTTAAATTACTGAASAVRAADALLAAFLGLVNVPCRGSNDHS